MSREAHVWICERLRGKLPRPTRLLHKHNLKRLNLDYIYRIIHKNTKRANPRKRFALLKVALPLLLEIKRHLNKQFDWSTKTNCYTF